MHFDSLALQAFIYLLIGILYIVVFTFASFLFSYKIYLVSNDKYVWGAFVSATGIFINFSLYAFVPFVAVAVSLWWLSVVMLVSLAIGSFVANAIMVKVDFFHDKEEKEAE